MNLCIPTWARFPSICFISKLSKGFRPKVKLEWPFSFSNAAVRWVTRKKSHCIRSTLLLYKKKKLRYLHRARLIDVPFTDSRAVARATQIVRWRALFIRGKGSGRAEPAALDCCLSPLRNLSSPITAVDTRGNENARNSFVFRRRNKKKKKQDRKFISHWMARLVRAAPGHAEEIVPENLCRFIE